MDSEREIYEPVWEHTGPVLAQLWFWAQALDVEQHTGPLTWSLALVGQSPPFAETARDEGTGHERNKGHEDKHTDDGKGSKHVPVWRHGPIN